MTETILRPKAKGIGDIAKHDKVTVEETGKVILEPYAEIPLSEKCIINETSHKT